METISCIFCNHTQATPAITEHQYTGHQCSSCNLIYISPRPAADEVLDLYGHDNAHLSAHNHIEGSFLKRLYARHTLNLISNYRKAPATILEIGAGAGYFLDEARKLGYTPYALELNPHQAQFIQKDLQIACEQKPLATNSFDGQLFDIIYHCDVISHFHNPIKEFQTLYAKLKPNGILIFETGNIGDIDHTYFSLFNAFQYPDHLFFFTQKNLEHLLAITGFTTQAIYSYSIVPYLCMQKAIQRFYKKRPANPQPHNSPSSNTIKNISLLKKVYYYMTYVMRYKIGRYCIKSNNPQTLIIVAQKK